MKKATEILEHIFYLVHVCFRPARFQRLLRSLGIQIPFRLARHLQYREQVPFSVNGKKFFLQSYNEPIEILIFWYGLFGKWEATQLRLWSKLVLEADVILDVGANTGVYSLVAATNPDATVYAFEPVDSVRDMLRENITINQLSTHVVPLVVGDHKGTVDFFIPRDGWVDVASVDKSFAIRGELNGSKVQKVTKDMTTIDLFLQTRQVPKEDHLLLKVDVEGAEKMVLQGMFTTMQRPNIEFTLELLEETYFVACLEYVTEEYNIYAIDEVKRAVYPCTHFVTGVTNYLFSKRKHTFDNLWA